MSSRIFKIFNLLAGEWIFDRILSVYGTVTGTACFQPLSPHILHYKESGQFTTPSQKTYRTSREYAYCYQEAPETLAAFFIHDARPDYLFHELNFAPLENGIAAASGSHACHDDMYYASYEFLHKDAFVITYLVVGPNKNYVSRTKFNRG